MKKTSYEAKFPDKNGLIDYTPEEDKTWHTLITRQEKIIPKYACQEYIDGLALLNFSKDKVPQPRDVSARLGELTGWAVEPVPALIPYKQFFSLLANKRFPAACFIRREEELDYLQEPDIFHELFGHCPMLTLPVYADFMEAYGKLGLTATPKQQSMLARLYWFTVEFGLIKTSQGLRTYGGGILSSYAETIYSIDSDIPQRKPLKVLDALRTPFRVDIKQTVYYIIKSFDEIYKILDGDLLKLVDEAIELGDFEPTFPPVGEEGPFTC